MKELNTNRHTRATIEGVSESPQSRNFIKTNITHANIRVPQVG